MEREIINNSILITFYISNHADIKMNKNIEGQVIKGIFLTLKLHFL